MPFQTLNVFGSPEVSPIAFLFNPVGLEGIFFTGCVVLWLKMFTAGAMRRF